MRKNKKLQFIEKEMYGNGALLIGSLIILIIMSIIGEGYILLGVESLVLIAVLIFSFIRGETLAAKRRELLQK